MNKPLILVVEDDSSVKNLITTTLTKVALFLTTFQAALTRAYRNTREPRLDIRVVLA